MKIGLHFSIMGKQDLLQTEKPHLMFAARFSWANRQAVPPVLSSFDVEFKGSAKLSNVVFKSINPNELRSESDSSESKIPPLETKEIFLSKRSLAVANGLRRGAAWRRNRGALDAGNQTCPGRLKIQYACRRGNTHSMMEGERIRRIFRSEWYDCRWWGKIRWRLMSPPPPIHPWGCW